MPRPGIEPGTPGSLIERHNHKAKRSGPVRLVIYAPYIFTYILIICTSLCRATTYLSSSYFSLFPGVGEKNWAFTILSSPQCGVFSKAVMERKSPVEESGDGRGGGGVEWI